MEIAQHTFLVTGGASGLGAACARRLVAGGGNVVVVDLNREAGEALVAELGDAARFAAADVADEAAVQAAVDPRGQRLRRAARRDQLRGHRHRREGARQDRPARARLCSRG